MLGIVRGHGGAIKVYSEQEIVNRFAGKGLAGFVQKPYTSEELLAKIREVLAR